MSNNDDNMADKTHHTDFNMRALLHNFYELESIEDESQPNSSMWYDNMESDDEHSMFNSPKNTRMQEPIDQQDFDANEYVNEILHTKDMKEIVDIQNGISGEVKALESDLQMLVYENYNKFISASDVIQCIQKQVSSMDDDMTMLSKAMSSLRESSALAEQSLASTRADLSELIGTRRLLSRLAFVFELPRTLRECISKSHFDEAVRLALTSLGIVEQFKDVKSFDTCRIETQHSVRDLKAALRQELKRDEVSISSTADAEQTHHHKGIEMAKLLLELNEPPQLLWHELLSTQRDALLVRITQATDDNINSCDALKLLNESFVPSFTSFVKAFKSAFVDVPNILQNSNSLCTEAFETLTVFSAKIFDRYAHDVHRIIFSNVEATHSVDDTVQTLRSNIECVQDALTESASLVPDAALNELIDNICNEALQTCIVQAFGNSHTTILRLIIDVTKEISETSNHIISESNTNITHSNDIIKEAAAQIITLLENAVVSLYGLLDTQFHAGLKQFIPQRFKLAIREVQRLLLCGLSLPSHGIIMSAHNNERFAMAHELWPLMMSSSSSSSSTTQNITQSSNSDDTHYIHHSLVLLVLSRIALELAQLPLQQHFEAIGAKFKISQQEYQDFTNLGPICISEFTECSQVLVGVFAEEMGASLASHIINTSHITDNTVINEVSKHMQTLQDQLVIFCPDTPPTKIFRTTTQKRTPRLPLRRDDIERMFHVRIQVFGAVLDSNLFATVFAILKIAFKSWIENIRIDAIDKQYLQQLQVNVHLIRMNLPPILTVDEASILDALLDEVLTSAVERCSDDNAILSVEAISQLVNSSTPS